MSHCLGWGVKLHLTLASIENSSARDHNMLDYILFLSCLEFAIYNSTYFNTISKPKQVICLEHLYLTRDVICVLPTGYGKSLIFHLLPALLFAKEMLLMNKITSPTH